MKKYYLAVILSTLLIIGAKAQDYAERMVNTHGAQWSQQMGWDYVSGLVTKSILTYCSQYPDASLTQRAYTWCKAYADQALNEDGSFINFNKGSLDNIASGKVLLSLYAAEEAKQKGSGAKYKAAADYLYDYLCWEYPRITQTLGNSCFIHKTRYPYQMWLDGLYMGAAYYAEYQAMFDPGDVEAWEDIALQFTTIHRQTYDTDEKLNYHGWSANPSDSNSFWARRNDPYKGCSSEFWGRGMGWYSAALADVLEYMPENLEYYAQLVEIFRQVIEGIVQRQDQTSGVWYQLLRYDDSFVSRNGNRNYLEASASCMFTYAILKGVRLGILPEEPYAAIGEKAYQGLIKTFIKTRRNGYVDIYNICRSAGLGPASDPSRDGSADYYLDGNDVNIVNNEGKGIGSFIFASLEYELALSASITDLQCEQTDAIAIYDIYGRKVNHATKGFYIYKYGDRAVKKLIK